MPNRDIIVIGASAGGVDALQKMAIAFPANLRAAVFVILHLPPTGRSFLPAMLSRVGPLPAVEPSDSERIAHGHIYVAGPDYHLLIANGHVHLTRSPKEGHHRPSINVTFRSAALAYGTRVIGVVLSGALDDGCAGLWEIKMRGGLAVVQDPDDALFPSMPRNALQQVPVDFTASIADIPALLARLCEGEAMEQRLHHKSEAREGTGYIGFTCPECHGPLSETRQDPVEFRCRVGHTFSTRMLLDGNTSARERKLYEAIVALEEGADIAEFAAASAEPEKREELVQKAEQLRRQAGSVREILQQIPAITLD
ncbi:MAG TPA: chemotaxis protein CheB [Candidatus Acidoferrum sp.]|nr:chemotaxis protein CheB [Candidatus Acidoferrum sp.]